ncbi:MAG: cysteine desulfurase NifS [Proteobacteria bacterium]|nr:MAG: cysteine desulfurase NifS [Pseudomonadota bacterium]
MIYLDHNATTPLLPEVAEAMAPLLYEGFANPSSPHALGRRVRASIDRARSQVAELLACEVDELVFTSGGTESNNHAIRGVVQAHREACGGALERDQIITSAVEHPAVLEVCRTLARREGMRLVELPVDAVGQVRLADLEAALDERTLLVSVMHANNEVGTLQPVAEIAERAHAAGALVHSDAAQSVGKIPVEVGALGVDLLTLAGHKLYAPKGIGGLVIRRGVAVAPLMQGAGHERGRRPGTENSMHIVGLGRAAELAREAIGQRDAMRELRDALYSKLAKALGDDNLRLNGHRDERLPNTLSVGLRDARADALLAALGDQVAASAGAACHGGGEAISSVLSAMGVPRPWARGTIRLSLGHQTTEEQLDQAVSAIVAALPLAR